MRAKGKELSGFIASPLSVLQLSRVTNYLRRKGKRDDLQSVYFSDIGLMGTTFESAEFLLVGVQVSKWLVRASANLSVRNTD